MLPKPRTAFWRTRPPAAASAAPQDLQQRFAGRVSYYEPRLDFWRQLWRVAERSDVALVLLDARRAPFYAPPSPLPPGLPTLGLFLPQTMRW